ncbi:MAG: hypothetical protein WD071_06615 [Pseudohongiella sp.]|uniref:hypothetical protein n=1 Tax=Pseudohongiella sp. TaxID=1979412 RepID=UPI00349FFCAE
MNPTVTDLAVFAGLTFVTVVWIRIVLLKLKMHRNQKRLKAARLYPSGSDIRHGMVMGKNGVEHDSQPSKSWYSRLAG